MESVMDVFPSIVKMEWSQVAVLKLIKFWSERDCLYNTKNQLYHNKHARCAAMEAISKNLQEIIPNITPHDVKIKINYLRSQYGRELQKVRESPRSGAGSDEIYVPSAYWFEHLHFLKDFLTVRKGKSNISYEEDDNILKDDMLPCSKRSKLRCKSSNDLNTSQKTSTSSDSDDILSVAKDYLLKISNQELETPEQEFENSTTSFFRTNIREIKDKNLQDELMEKIMLLVFEYKKKQRELDSLNSAFLI